MQYELSPDNGRKSFYGKAVVVQEEGTTKLKSYNTTVCSIVDSNVILNSAWTYSNTTVTHVCTFLRRFGFNVNSKSDVQKKIDKGEFEYAV